MEKIKKGMTKDQQEFVDLIFHELDRIPCTGWVDRGVTTAETVFEHTVRVNYNAILNTTNLLE